MVTRLCSGLGVVLLTACGASSGTPTSTPGVCSTPATVTYSVPGGSPVALTSTSMDAVTVKVGQPITFTFTGPCATGGRLYLNPNPDGHSAYTDVWVGQSTGTWSASSPGKRALSPAWACLGPISCPLEMLGVLTVTSPA